MSTSIGCRCALAVFLTAAPLFASAAETYQCVENDRTGFLWNGQNMERGRLPGANMVLAGEFPLEGGAPTEAVLQIEGIRSPLAMGCTVPFFGQKPVLCTSGSHTLVLDRDSGRFTLARQFGWVFEDLHTGAPNEDTFTVGWGMCTRGPGAAK